MRGWQNTGLPNLNAVVEAIYPRLPPGSTKRARDAIWLLQVLAKALSRPHARCTAQRCGGVSARTVGWHCLDGRQGFLTVLNVSCQAEAHGFDFR